MLAIPEDNALTSSAAVAGKLAEDVYEQLRQSGQIPEWQLSQDDARANRFGIDLWHSIQLFAELHCGCLHERLPYDAKPVLARTLMVLSEHGDLVALQAVLRLAGTVAAEELLSVSDNDQVTALHYAAANGQCYIVRELADAISGADAVQSLVMARNSEDKTALHWAAEFGHVDAIQELTSACPNDEACRALLMEGDQYQFTALHHAAAGGHAAAVCMLAHSAPTEDVRVEFLTAGNYRQATALHSAVYSGHAACVQALVAAMQHEIRITHFLVSRDQNRCTALHWAAGQGRESAASALLAAAPYPEDRLRFCRMKDSNKATAAEIASKNGYKNLRRLLYQAEREAASESGADSQWTCGCFGSGGPDISPKNSVSSQPLLRAERNAERERDNVKATAQSDEVTNAVAEGDVYADHAEGEAPNESGANLPTAHQTREEPSAHEPRAQENLGQPCLLTQSLNASYGNIDVDLAQKAWAGIQDGHHSQPLLLGQIIANPPMNLRMARGWKGKLPAQVPPEVVVPCTYPQFTPADQSPINTRMERGWKRMAELDHP